MAETEQHQKCSGHKGEHLQPAEKMAVTVATAQTRRGESVPPNTATVLLMTIDRLEHQVAHAACGALECDDDSDPWPAP